MDQSQDLSDSRAAPLLTPVGSTEEPQTRAVLAHVVTAVERRGSGSVKKLLARGSGRDSLSTRNVYTYQRASDGGESAQLELGGFRHGAIDKVTSTDDTGEAQPPRIVDMTSVMPPAPSPPANSLVTGSIMEAKHRQRRPLGNWIANSFLAGHLLRLTLTILIVDAAAWMTAVFCLDLNCILVISGENQNVFQKFVKFSLFANAAAPLSLIIGLSSFGTGIFRSSTCFSDAIVSDVFLNIILTLIRSLYERQGSSRKLKRKLWLQLCELAVVALIVLFIFWLFFVIVSIPVFVKNTIEKDSDTCKSTSKAAEIAVMILGLVKMIISYVQVKAFDRFRTRSRTHLGVFDELSQTSNITKARRYSKKNNGLLRKRIYKAVTLNDEFKLMQLLDSCREKYGVNFASKMYPSPSLMLGMFAYSVKNPMHAAAATGNTKLLQILLNYGFDVNSLDKVDKMRFSVSSLYISMTMWLSTSRLQATTSGTQVASGSVTFQSTLVSPLHVAAARGKLLAVRWLLNQGANVDQVALSTNSDFRTTPLFLAEDAQVAVALLKGAKGSGESVDSGRWREGEGGGANILLIPDPKKKSTSTVLELAYLRHNDHLCSVYEEWGGDISLTPLHSAAAKGDLKGISKLLALGAHVDTRGEHCAAFSDRTPLHWAAISGETKACQLLLDSGADYNARDAKGLTPLHWAARRNRLEIVELLLKKGADPNCRSFGSSGKKTPMLFAADFDGISKELISAMKAHGMNINATVHESGDTALHIAAKKENLVTAISLVSCDADVMAVNTEGLRAIDCTTSTALAYAIKNQAGARDVMISYTHSHAEFALKIRDSLKKNNITVWMDSMNPSGIEGGAVWRGAIARGIKECTVVLCLLSEDYPHSEWCLKELALAKQSDKPIVAVSCEHVSLTDEMQVYLYTRQIIPFQCCITSAERELREGDTEPSVKPKQVTFTYDEPAFARQFTLLLDGLRDEIERDRVKRRDDAERRRLSEAPDVLAILMDSRSMMKQGNVFITHGDHHLDFVMKLVAELRSYGVSCYIDSEHYYSSTQERIHAAKDAILLCSAFIAVLSQDSVQSSILSDQLAFAEDKGKLIVPVLYSEPKMDLAKLYSLSRSKFVHFAGDLGFRHSVEMLLKELRGRSDFGFIASGGENPSFMSNIEPMNTHGGQGGFGASSRSITRQDSSFSTTATYTITKSPQTPTRDHVSLIL